MLKKHMSSPEGKGIKSGCSKWKENEGGEMTAQRRKKKVKTEQQKVQEKERRRGHRSIDYSKD